MYSKRYITLRHCLSHTTGIKADEPGLKSLLTRKKYASLEEEATAIAKREIDHNPGETFFYSSIGLNLAARVCEVVTKKGFERLIQERITRPLKMRATNFNNGDFNVAPNPSGGAVSSAADYLNFLTMILNRGVFEGKRILSEKSIEEMEKIQTGRAVIQYTPKVAQGYDYGLGEWIQDKDASGKGMVVACPGLFGTWPMVDNCRGYACLFFVKTLLSEERKDIYLSLKDLIDQQIPSNCKP
jgi:CubicO group peptidase (beta-lactamase class C family)